MTSNGDVRNLAQIANFDLELTDSVCSLYEADSETKSIASTTTLSKEENRTISNNSRSLENGKANNDDSESESDPQETAPQEPSSSALPQHRVTSLVTSRISFGSIRNMQTSSLQSDSDEAITMALAVATDSEDEDYDYVPKAKSAVGAAMRKEKKKPEGVLKKHLHKKPKSERTERNRPLSYLGQQYDLDGDGSLDTIERAMRDADKDGDGQLDTKEVYRIVQSQIKSKEDIKLYRKVSAGLLCLIFILALSNFGTSWATAILSRETVADTETGTIQSTSGDVVALQQIAHEVELDALTDEEFEERRRLVDAEMEEDPEHEDHLHRRLGKKGQKNKCACSKIAYDNGKMSEKALRELTYKCNGVNTVSIKRKWKNSDGTENIDIDTICGPGTTVSTKGRRKKNKNKTRTKVVDDRVTFKRQGKNGQDRDINFDCKNGFCFGSGKTLLQGIGHSCNLQRENGGTGECEAGLVCYDKEDDKKTGVCVKLQRSANKNQLCDVSLGVDACVPNHACYKNNNFSMDMDGVVKTGVCEKVRSRNNNKNNNNNSAGSFANNGGSNSPVDDSDFCDGGDGQNACDRGYICLGGNGREIDEGIGYCTQFPQRQRSGGTCNLANGNNACNRGFYCQDMQANRNGGGNGSRNGGMNAVISGPSGTVVAGEGGGQTTRTFGLGVCTQLPTRGRVETCDLANGNNACNDGFYCQDMQANRNGGGNGSGNGGMNAVIAGPSGTVVAGEGGGQTPRTSGEGVCTQLAGSGETCRSDDACGRSYSCQGLGDDTATGGVIRGSSGTIVWGTGGSTTGRCG